MRRRGLRGGARGRAPSAARAGALGLALAGCSAAPLPPAPVEVPQPPPPPSAVAPAPVAPAPEAPGVTEARRKVAAMLGRVAERRGLPVKAEVPSRVLDRQQILEKIRAKVEKEIPRDVVEHEGELLAALELAPPEYDFVEGSYRLIQGRIAGFYEPADRTMYLADDLAPEETEETLAHELEHALQDQSYALGGLLRFVPGEGDRASAIHALAEGDALSASFDVTLGSATRVSAEALRQALSTSNAAATTGPTTPHVLQETLSAPYGDGFAFVQALRAQGGWAAVDAAWRDLPVTTEQLLHPDKYAAREPPLPVARPTLAALGPGFREATHDALGEQGLRILFAEWTTPARAAEAAAGWGGDRYVVARRDDGPGRHTIAVAWRAEMDTERDAKEVAAVLEPRLGRACRERPGLGPIAWKRQGRALALVAGPYQRAEGPPKSAGTCALAKAWLGELLGRPGAPAKP